jgi:glycerol-3-phosphate dehydrogenase (NAD(P)+)
MHVGVVGLGNLGTAIANVVATNGHTVVGWEYQASVVAEINDSRRNSRFLPGIDLHPQLRATSQLDAVFDGAEMVFIALPSAYIRPTLEAYCDTITTSTIIVNTAKGIDRHTGLTALQTLGRLLPRNSCVMLSGPSIANEFVRGVPTLVMLAGPRNDTLWRVARVLDNASFRARFSTDALGVELGGVLKNAYVIGLGVLDQLHGQGANVRAVYLTLALEEMARLGVALGARQETFFYLAGIGDLLATALSEHSHNRALGARLASGQPIGEIERAMGVLPEGYNTLQTLLFLAEKMNTHVPLASELWALVNGRTSPAQFLRALVNNFASG